MSFGILDLFTLFGSIGMFLYGMKLMSEGLQKAAGERMRSILAKITNNRFIGALTGIIITALIQSSSATTVMIVSFVNAGLMTLSQSMAVIMGANVGTTATAWIISIFGFKVDIAAFAIPMIAVAMPLMFSKRNSWKNWAELILGFAFLFLGLEYLSASVPDLKSNPEIFEVLHKYSDFGFISILLFAFFGMLITVIVQSSSASFAIILIMCSKGWISFEIAAAMILGSNIGTCITPIIASVQGNIQSKRSALGHLLFNVFGSIWTLVLFFPFINLIISISTHITGNPTELISFVNSTDSTVIHALNDGTLDSNIPENAALIDRFATMQYNVSFGLSVFHTIFNIINIAIMIWFTNAFVYIVKKLVPSKPKHNEDDAHIKYISTGLLSTAELSIVQASKEINLFAERIKTMQASVRELFHADDSKEFSSVYSRIQKYENISDRMEIEIANYLNNVFHGRLSDETKHNLQTKIRIVSDIESVGDCSYNIAKTIQRKKENNAEFTSVQTENVELMFNLVDSAIQQMITSLSDDTITTQDINKSHNLENEINNFRNQLKIQNTCDVNNGACEYINSIIYMDIILECERLGDVVIDIVETIAEGRLSNNTSLKL